MMASHDLKIQQPYFDRVVSGAKRAEIRKNDRDFHVGDELWLREFDAASQSYTGRHKTVSVTDTLFGPTYGIEDGYVMLSISDAGQDVQHSAPSVAPSIPCPTCGGSGTADKMTLRMLARRGETPTTCPTCHGTGVRP